MNKSLTIFICFSFLIACTDQSAKSYFEDGLWALNMDDVQGAIKNYRKAIEINTEYHEVRHRLASIYIDEKEYDKAMFHCNYLIEKNALEMSPYYCVGVIHFEKEDYMQAAEMLEKQMKFDPNTGGAPRWLAKAYIKLNKFNDAEKALVIQKNQADYDVGYNKLMGEILIGQGKKNEAQQFFSKAKSLNLEYSR